MIQRGNLAVTGGHDVALALVSPEESHQSAFRLRPRSVAPAVCAALANGDVVEAKKETRKDNGMAPLQREDCGPVGES